MQKEKKFFSYFEKLLQENGVRYVVEILKNIGIGVNVYNNSRSNKLYERIIQKLREVAEKEDLKLVEEFEFQISILNLLFSSFYNQKIYKEINSEPNEFTLYGSIIALELLLRVIKDQVFNNGKNRALYPFEITIDRNYGREIKNITKMSPNDQVEFIELVTQSSSKVIAFLQFYLCTGIEEIEINEEIPVEEIYKLLDHYRLIDIRTIIYDLFEDWKFNQYNISVNGKEISVFPVDKDEYKAKRISLNRFDLLRYKFMYRQYRATDIDHNSKFLPPKQFIDEIEVTDSIIAAQLFFSNDLDELCEKVIKDEEGKEKGKERVPLNCWIRAYNLIRKECETFLTSSLFPDSFSLNKWCLVKSKDDWIELFTKYGIPGDKASIIIKYLTFTRDSIDFFDCPFVKIKDRLILIPSLCARISASTSIISNLSKNDFNISFKGDNFEKTVRSAIEEKGIEPKKLYSIVKKEENKTDEYECDIAFYLGKDLYLCECKAFIQPKTSRGFFELEHKKKEALVQLKRISTYYEENIKVVNKELGMNEYKKPKNVYKILIITPMLGKEEQIDETTFIVDASAFKSFLDRQKPALIFNNKKYELRNTRFDQLFDGGISSKKLINYLKNPPLIALQKIRHYFVEQQVPIGDYTLNKLYSLKLFDDFVTYKNDNNDNLIKLIKYIQDLYSKA